MNILVALLVFRNMLPTCCCLVFGKCDVAVASGSADKGCSARENYLLDGDGIMNCTMTLSICVNVHVLPSVAGYRFADGDVAAHVCSTAFTAIFAELDPYALESATGCRIWHP